MGKTIQQELEEIRAKLEAFLAQYTGDGTFTKDEHDRLDVLAQRAKGMKQASDGRSQGKGTTDDGRDHQTEQKNEDSPPGSKRQALPDWKLYYDIYPNPRVEKLVEKMLKLMEAELKKPAVVAKLEAAVPEIKAVSKNGYDPYYVLQREYFFLEDTWLVLRDKELASDDPDRIMVGLKVGFYLDQWHHQKHVEIERQIDKANGKLTLEERFEQVIEEIDAREKQFGELLDEWDDPFAPVSDPEAAERLVKLKKYIDELAAARLKLNELRAESNVPEKTLREKLKEMSDGLKRNGNGFLRALDVLSGRDKKARKPNRPAKP